MLALNSGARPVAVLVHEVQGNGREPIESTDLPDQQGREFLVPAGQPVGKVNGRKFMPELLTG